MNTSTIGFGSLSLYENSAVLMFANLNINFPCIIDGNLVTAVQKIYINFSLAEILALLKF
jgi:hypothetical protein